MIIDAASLIALCAGWLDLGEFSSHHSLIGLKNGTNAAVSAIKSATPKAGKEPAATMFSNPLDHSGLASQSS